MGTGSNAGLFLFRSITKGGHQDRLSLCYVIIKCLIIDSLTQLYTDHDTSYHEYAL